MGKIKKIIIFVLVFVMMSGNITAYGGEMQLNAISACLIDATNGRVLYEKNGYEKRAVASTTKIMTCILAIENADLERKVIFSKYAAGMPDVQMNAREGEEYILRDLLYAMMLESYNDVAVAVAESVSGNVKDFALLMNQKAKELGCDDTYFITPNGLDAVDENGVANTSTAVDMARIAAYAIKNEEFVRISTTKCYSFCELNGKRNVTVNNKDAFLNQMEGAIGVKTGFTGKAGYCFVGALKKDGKVLVSVVLASGWPPNKTYKSKDTAALMNYGLRNFQNKIVYDGYEECGKIKVVDGVKPSVDTYAKGHVELQVGNEEKVTVYYNMLKELKAPVKSGQTVGQIEIFIDDTLYETIPIKTKASVKKTDFYYYFTKVWSRYCGQNKKNP